MRRLDPAQKAAATSTAAIQLTLAGPGAGKTSTLTGRFIHLVRQGVDPARILGLTFTRKAADEMARRIAGLLELTSPARLNLMTFHAFAFRLLKRNPVMAGLPERFDLWDDARQRHVFTSRRMWWNEEVDILEVIGGAKRAPRCRCCRPTSNSAVPRGVIRAHHPISGHRHHCNRRRKKRRRLCPVTGVSRQRIRFGSSPRFQSRRRHRCRSSGDAPAPRDRGAVWHAEDAYGRDALPDEADSA